MLGSYLLTADQELLGVHFSFMLCTCQCFHYFTPLLDMGPLAMCSAFSIVAFTSELQMPSRVIDHSLRWNRNNVKTLINDGQRNWPLQQSLLQCNQSHMINCIPSLITSAWRAKIALILDPIPDPRQVLIVTSALDQNNLLNSTTLTLFFTVRSTRPHILEIYN